MPKRVEIDIHVWKGSVEIADPLTIPQAKAIEAGMAKPEITDGQDRVWLSLIDEMQLPALMACVTNWELSNFPAKVTADTFPASPRGKSHELIDAIFRELMKVYFGEAIVPNE